MDNDSPQAASRYPEMLTPAPRGQGLVGANTPVRESEVSRELNQVSRDAVTLKKLSEELIQRLASVVIPRDNEINKNPEQTEPGVTTPLATNIREVHQDLQITIKAINFILRGLEL